MIALSSSYVAKPPSCPVFPATWTPEIAAAASAHAKAVYPHEAVGIVAAGRYERLVNLSATPGLEALLSDADLLAVAERAALFYHSHPDGPACPSEADMRYQAQLDIPFVIQTWPEGDTFCFGDTLEGAPLLGRAFRHGVHDCYSLIRDWYWLKRQVRLPHEPRDWEWWNRGRTIYTDGLAGAGFEPIPVAEATREGDGLLFNLRNATPMHAALVMTPDLILHHIAGARPYDPTRLSRLEPRTRWLRWVTMAVRRR
jgi:proteasome lid subunit RPN8/RPN11